VQQSEGGEEGGQGIRGWGEGNVARTKYECKLPGNKTKVVSFFVHISRNINTSSQGKEKKIKMDHEGSIQSKKGGHLSVNSMTGCERTDSSLRRSHKQSGRKNCELEPRQETIRKNVKYRHTKRQGEGKEDAL